ncbi:MAG TPA: carbohydrate-binding protein [Lachnospiraceae bacterium]|nr:carbohydrate-binding protein [Lachnospiraceae bacterium]
MAILSLKILHANGDTVCVSSGENEVNLVHTCEYVDGDRISITSSENHIFLVVQVDDALGSAFVYFTEKECNYYIPFGEKRVCYSPKVFVGNRHLLTARVATKEEIASYKNLALNVMDQHGDTNCYPHATANVETRGESVFAARNAIDGVRENRSHGEWPYQSWGINRQDDAQMKVDFGREVITDKIKMYTRADFPHDNWWTKVTIEFSDGSEIEWELEKSYDPHILTFEKKKVSWIVLKNLIKADDPSPFPALTQIEVYGVEA